MSGADWLVSGRLFAERHLFVRRARPNGTTFRPNGALYNSPGQRPGDIIHQNVEALKGRYLRGVTLIALLASLPGITSLRAEVQIERIFMPLDASPSSFAIGLPGGVNFCFDPLRAAVSYVWTGGFLDVSPARPGPGKFISAVKLLGPVVYRETGSVPLRRGDPARSPTIEFTGYTLRNDAVEFHYTVDGIAVREEIRARPDGAALIRRLQIEAGTDAKWWHVVDGKPPTELKREPNGVFVLELPLGKVAP